MTINNEFEPNNQSKVVFFGGDDMGRSTLEYLLSKNYQILMVTTLTDNYSPFGPSALATAQENNLEIIYSKKPRTDLALIQRLKEFVASVAILISFNAIISKEIIDIFPLGIVNLHPSLLPKYRGPDPITPPILNGDKTTGLSLMILDEQMDHGPILAQEEIDLDPKITHSQLRQILAERGAILISNILPEYLAGQIKPEKQDHEAATFSKKLTREDGKIDWYKSAKEIERKIRAYEVWPETYTQLNGFRVKIIRVALPSVIPDISVPIGTLIQLQDKIFVSCGPATDKQEGSEWLEIVSVQREGKKTLPALDFYNGLALKTSLVFH